MSVNSVQILGFLGKNPVVTTTKAGVTVCNFSVATTDRWTDRSTGEKKEHTEWHNIVCFGKLAEIASKYLRTGSQVFLTGSLTTEKYERDGQTHYSTKIKMAEMQMLNHAKESNQQQVQQPMQQMQQGYVQQPMQQLPQQQVVQQMAMPQQMMQQQPMQQMQVQSQQPMQQGFAPPPSNDEWVWDNIPNGF